MNGSIHNQWPVDKSNETARDNGNNKKENVGILR